jgi:hypothetical protein
MPTATSYSVVVGRIQKSEPYKRAFDLAVAMARAGMLTCDDPAALRALGGRTNIARAAIEAACMVVPDVTLNMGSVLIPMTPAEVLKTEPIVRRVVDLAHIQEMHERSMRARAPIEPP